MAKFEKTIIGDFEHINNPKELSELSLEELWQLFPIILKEHNENYINWYKHERKNIESYIDKKDIKRINHIGSSAVKDLLSKPTVDILLELSVESEIDDISKLIVDSGWGLMSSKKEPYLNYVFNKGYSKYGFEEKVYHLHVRALGDWKELYFRDYLMEHSEVAKKYGELKLELEKEYKHNRDGYTNAKSEFIEKYTEEARVLYQGRYSIIK